MTTNGPRFEPGALLLSLATVAIAAAIGGAATATSVGTWYVELERPTWNPPDWIFGPVWTTLFAMMAVAAWLVWRRRHDARDAVRVALALYGAQLALNVCWSLLFFGMRAPGLALVEIVVLWLAIAATIRAFVPVSRAAAGLLVPYAAWVALAGVLNGTIWWLNR